MAVRIKALAVLNTSFQMNLFDELEGLGKFVSKLTLSTSSSSSAFKAILNWKAEIPANMIAKGTDKYKWSDLRKYRAASTIEIKA